MGAGRGGLGEGTGLCKIESSHRRQPKHFFPRKRKHFVCFVSRLRKKFGKNLPSWNFKMLKCWEEKKLHFVKVLIIWSDGNLFRLKTAEKGSQCHLGTAAGISQRLSSACSPLEYCRMSIMPLALLSVS